MLEQIYLFKQNQITRNTTVFLNKTFLYLVDKTQVLVILNLTFLNSNKQEPII